MTKVGIYVLLRLWLLLFGETAGDSAQFGDTWLLYGGLMTIAFGAIGVLGSQDMRRLAGFSLLVSSGTLLAALGTGHPAALGRLLFYLVASTLAIGVFFLLNQLVRSE